MTMQATLQSVERTVTVKATRERAFEVFTERFDAWWPRSHHLLPEDMAEAVLERREGGRWYERSVKGDECDWGRVLAWEPPERVLLSWEIKADFSGLEEGAANGSEVEVRFVEIDPETTRVELEHRHFERHGAGAEKMREAVGSEGGWGAGLQAFADLL